MFENWGRKDYCPIAPCSPFPVTLRQGHLQLPSQLLILNRTSEHRDEPNRVEAEEVMFCGTEAAEWARSWTTTQHGNETWSLSGAEWLAPQPYHVWSQL